MADNGREDDPVDLANESSEDEDATKSKTSTKAKTPSTGDLVAEITQQVLAALQKKPPSSKGEPTPLFHPPAGCDPYMG